ncbi:MAG: alpha/beta hydrolase [Bacteroidota bacterium]
MKNRARRYVFWSAVGLLIFLLFMVLPPKSYHVPAYKARPGTRFWNLPGGSQIGYFLIPSNGKRKLYPVIFLQGGPGAPVYNRNIELLAPLAADGYEVYLYDQVGCGSSERLENIGEYTVERHRRDLEEIVTVIGAEKVILIGQSWGAMLACAYIAENPDKVEKVIFTGPGPVLPWNSESETTEAPDSLHLKQPVYTNSQGRKKTYNLRARVVEACARAFNLKLAPDREMDDFSTLLNNEMGKSTVCNPEDPAVIDSQESGSGYYVMVKTVQSFGRSGNIRSKLAACQVPALIMRGQCDGKAWGYTAEYLRLFINHRLIIVPDAGHSIGIEQPVAYTRTISDFLEIR